MAEELCRLVDGQPMSTGVSCGVASTDSLAGHVDTPLRLFRLADAAQYRAKRAGLRRPGRGRRGVAGAELEDARPDRRARRGRLAVDGRRCSSRGWRCSTAGLEPGRRRGSRRSPTTCSLLADGAGLVGLLRRAGGEPSCSSA